MHARPSDDLWCVSPAHGRALTIARDHRPSAGGGIVKLDQGAVRSWPAPTSTPAATPSSFAPIRPRLPALPDHRNDPGRACPGRDLLHGGQALNGDRPASRAACSGALIGCPNTMALTRRALLLQCAAAPVAAAAGVGYAAGQEGDGATPHGDDHIVDFHGEHQAGIATPAQDRLHFAAFDVTAGTKATELRDAAQASGRAASVTMAGGQPIGERRRGLADRAARRHRRGARPHARQPHRHVRLRALPLRRPLRPRRPAANGPHRAS